MSMCKELIGYGSLHIDNNNCLVDINGKKIPLLGYSTKQSYCDYEIWIDSKGNGTLVDKSKDRQRHYFIEPKVDGEPRLPNPFMDTYDRIFEQTKENIMVLDSLTYSVNNVNTKYVLNLLTKFYNSKSFQDMKNDEGQLLGDNGKWKEKKNIVICSVDYKKTLSEIILNDVVDWHINRMKGQAGILKDGKQVKGTYQEIFCPICGKEHMPKSNCHDTIALNSRGGPSLVSFNNKPDEYYGRDSNFMCVECATKYAWALHQIMEQSSVFLNRGKGEKVKDILFVWIKDEVVDSSDTFYNESLQSIDDEIDFDADDDESVATKNKIKKANKLTEICHEIKTIGTSGKISKEDNVNLLILELPEKGRARIKMYNEITVSELADNIEEWKKYFQFGLYDICKTVGTLASNNGNKKTEKIMKRDMESLVNSCFFGEKLNTNFVEKAIKVIILNHIHNMKHAKQSLQKNHEFVEMKKTEGKGCYQSLRTYFIAHGIIQKYIKEIEMKATEDEKKKFEIAKLCGKMYQMFYQSFLNYHIIGRGWTKAKETNYDKISFAINNFREYYTKESKEVQSRKNRIQRKRPNWMKIFDNIENIDCEMNKLIGEELKPNSFSIAEKSKFFEGMNEQAQEMKAYWNMLGEKNKAKSSTKIATE